jgi:sterol desaturase/sphingolipid hydroxylase (fatty acid hydroxylase superfamily)
VLMLVLVDLKHYAWHRFMHLAPFWELHKYHHSATEFNLITTSRGHFLEKGILVIFDSILFSLLGAAQEQFIFFLVFQEFYDQLLHSNLGTTYGWLGRYILVSPMAHRLHHSQHKIHYNKNFGNLFVLWDKLFGTYEHNSNQIDIGVKNNPYNKRGFWWDMVEGSRLIVMKSVLIVRQKIFRPNKHSRKHTSFIKNNLS